MPRFRRASSEKPGFLFGALFPPKWPSWRGPDFNGDVGHASSAGLLPGGERRGGDVSPTNSSSESTPGGGMPPLGTGIADCRTVALTAGGDRTGGGGGSGGVGTTAGAFGITTIIPQPGHFAGRPAPASAACISMPQRWQLNRIIEAFSLCKQP
jgi:hypothetical protein